jgi:hypothetical protein
MLTCNVKTYTNNEIDLILARTRETWVVWVSQMETAPAHSQVPLALDQSDRDSELMKLNGVSPVPPPPDNDAPLNLSLKPALSPQPNNALQSLSSLSQSLGQMPDRICEFKQPLFMCPLFVLNGEKFE